MANEYLDLHNLEETEIPFAVARVIDEDLQASPECQLPADVPLTISLPSLDIDLPDLACNFQVDIPLVPLPHFCTPILSGSIGLNTCDPDVLSISNNTVQFSRLNDCDWQLQGSIDLCVTLPEPGIQCTDISLSFTNNGDTTDGKLNKVTFKGNDVGEIEIGTDINGGGVGCTQMMNYESKAQIEINTGLVSTANADGVTFDCESTEPLQLEYDEADGAIRLFGNIPGLCFDCAAAPNVTTELNIETLMVSTITFNNGCCTNDVATWDTCGGVLVVGQTSSNTVTLTATTGDPSIVLRVAGSDEVTITNGLFDLASSSDSGRVIMATSALNDRTASFREIQVCVDGALKKMMVLATEVYD